MQDNNPKDCLKHNEKPQILIIGAGLTGLTAAHVLRKQGKDVLVIEKENRIGGQIRTFKEQG